MVFTPYVEDKIWGSVQHIFGSPYAGVSCLTIKKGYRCSTHYHEYRGNLFNVLEGVLVVETFNEEPCVEGTSVSLATSKVLHPGDTLTVPAGDWHRFRTLTNGRVVEVYWDDRGPVDQDDIVRLDEGCKENWEELVALYGNPEVDK